jgi:hypothetical protein
MLFDICHSLKILFQNYIFHIKIVTYFHNLKNISIKFIKINQIENKINLKLWKAIY